MDDRQALRSKSRLWWTGVIGVVIVVTAMVVTLCMLQFGRAEPSTVDRSIPALVRPSEPETEDVSDLPPIGYRVGNSAPPFSLRSLDGKMISLEDYQGRVVILDFWASWCVPCRLSMPSLETMAGELGDDVVLVGISLDRSESVARSFIESRGYTDLIVLYGSLDEARRVSEEYAVLGIPKTFVIDPQGIIRFAGHPNSLSRYLVESLL